MRNHASGYTLTELMVTMAIIALAVIVVPPMTKWVGQQGIRHAVDQLRADLQRARLMAINQKQRCAIRLNTPEAGQYQNSVNQQIVNLDSYRGGLRFLDPGPDGTSLSSRAVFNRQGMSALAQPVDLFLADQENRSIYRVRISMPGGISVRRWVEERWQ